MKVIKVNASQPFFFSASGPFTGATLPAETFLPQTTLMVHSDFQPAEV